MSDAEEKVIAFRTEDGLPLSPRRFTKACYPHCKGAWINEEARTVECRTCGRMIEPFDYLWGWAIEGNSMERHMSAMKERTRLLDAEVRVLEDRIRELKSEQRKASK